jgi:hypothetical protein
MRTSILYRGEKVGMFKKRQKLSKQPRNYQAIPRQKQPIFSYSSSRKRQNSSQPEEDKKNDLSFIARIQYGLAGLLLLLGIGYVLSLDANAQIKIEGSTSFPRQDSEYEQSVSEALSRNFLNRTKVTIDKQKLEQEVKNIYPEIRLIEVKTSLLRHKPVIVVQLSEPTAKLVTPSEEFVLDEQGRALFNAREETTSFNVNELIPIHDNSGHDVEIGKPAVTSQQISYIREVIGQFKHKDIPIKTMALEVGGLELHVKLADANYFVKFNFLADPKQSSGAFIALREQNLPVNQYVDVRIPDHVYIK